MYVRELILARLREVLETVPGLATNPDATVRGVGRNRADVSGAARPAIIMQDGAEEVSDLVTGTAPRRSGVQLMSCEPEIVVLVGQPTEEVGTVANGFLAALLNVVLNDSTLIELCGGPRGNGDIQYRGCQFESASGETREGRMNVNIAFIYVFKATDLA